MTLKKPIRFSYKQYTELREAYESLLADNQKLMADNRKLREKVAKLETLCDISEAIKNA